MTHEQRLKAAQKALAAALREWHRPTDKADKADMHVKWTNVIKAAEELRKAKADSAL